MRYVLKSFKNELYISTHSLTYVDVLIILLTDSVDKKKKKPFTRSEFWKSNR